jgi:DNA-binding transcriptional ArsR family regulator
MGPRARGRVDPQDLLESAGSLFGLLSTPMRLHIVWVLAEGECDVTTLADQVGGALPAVSQHLTKLKLAGVVRSRRDGRRQFYAVDDPRVVEIVRIALGRGTGPQSAAVPRHGRAG